MKEIGQNLNKKFLYLTILIKIVLIYSNNINSILHVHAPLKKVNKYKLKFKTNPGLPLRFRYQVLLKTSY